jgi:hypothetical protein
MFLRGHCDGWLTQALKLFNGYPSLGMLGGYRGRIDNGKQQIKEQKQNNGEKYGGAVHKLNPADP